MKKNVSAFVKKIGKKKDKKTRAELNEEARKQKKLKNRKGLPPGSRHQEHTNANLKKASVEATDPRLGSKVKIDLTKYSEPVINNEQPHAVIDSFGSQVTETQLLDAKTRIMLEKELLKLESSPRLEQLLLQADEGELLSEEDTLFVETSLDRVAELYELLGIEMVEEELSEDDALEEDEKNDDLMRLLKS